MPKETERPVYALYQPTKETPVSKMEDVEHVDVQGAQDRIEKWRNFLSHVGLKPTNTKNSF